MIKHDTPTTSGDVAVMETTAPVRGSPPKTRYANTIKIKWAVLAARDCGIDVAGLRLRPDGTIEVYETRAHIDMVSEFDRWKGQL